MASELDVLEGKLKAFLQRIEISLGILHENVNAVATATGVDVKPAPEVPPQAPHVGLTSDDPNAPVELTPEAALSNGQIINSNSHYFAWFRSLTAEQLAAWCVAFLEQGGAAAEPNASNAIVTVGGVPYAVNDTAQGIIINLANTSGAAFPIS